jgi:FkbM family methyltransferase
MLSRRERTLSRYRSAKQFVKRARRAVFEAAGSDRYSRLAHHDIERKLSRFLDFRGGTFIEAGANDGLKQSNTYWLERFRGWRGLLVEATPRLAKECRRNRPNATVVNAALVADNSQDVITVTDGDLMGYITGHFHRIGHEELHRQQAAEYQNITLHEVQAPARTLSRVLDETCLPDIDFMSIDVEGYELDVFRGLDVERHAPRFILAEANDPAPIIAVLSGRYEFVEQITPNDLFLRRL